MLVEVGAVGGAGGEFELSAGPPVVLDVAFEGQLPVDGVDPLSGFDGVLRAPGGLLGLPFAVEGAGGAFSSVGVEVYGGVGDLAGRPGTLFRERHSRLLMSPLVRHRSVNSVVRRCTPRYG